LSKRKATWSEEHADGRWRCYGYDEILKRDKLNLDFFWIKDQSLTDADSLPPPDVLAAEITDELEAAFDLFSKIAAKLPKSGQQSATGVTPGVTTNSK
jgi:type I restriction enzyme M protein